MGLICRLALAREGHGTLTGSGDPGEGPVARQLGGRRFTLAVGQNAFHSSDGAAGDEPGSAADRTDAELAARQRHPRVLHPRPVSPRCRGQLTDALGDQAAISKSTVSTICGQIKNECEAWAQRRLDDVTLDCLYLDASFFRMHPGSPAEPVLAAWGITTSGKPAFIGLGPGSGEFADAWHTFLSDLKDRGLASPLLVISDAPGLIAAIKQAYPQALRQCCLIHRG
jgi:Transposase, Mutator family